MIETSLTLISFVQVSLYQRGFFRAQVLHRILSSLAKNKILL